MAALFVFKKGDGLWSRATVGHTPDANGDHGEFKLLVRFPASTEWQSNEKTHPAEDGGLRLVTLKSVSGPGDDGTPCITVTTMLPDED